MPAKNKPANMQSVFFAYICNLNGRLAQPTNHLYANAL